MSRDVSFVSLEMLTASQSDSWARGGAGAGLPPSIFEPERRQSQRRPGWRPVGLEGRSLSLQVVKERKMQAELTLGAGRLIEEQLKEDGMTVDPTALLSEAVFAGNSMLAQEGVTPYNAVYGRQPPLLPDTALPLEDTEGSQPGLTRHVHRLREVSLQKLIEATSRHRVQRALKAHTKPAGEEFDYKVGDSVEYHRPAGQNKNVSGWIGPAAVTDTIRFTSFTFSSGTPVLSRLTETTLDRGKTSISVSTDVRSLFHDR